MKPKKEDQQCQKRMEYFLKNETIIQTSLLVMLCCSVTLLVMTGFLIGSYKIHYFTLAREIFLFGPVLMIIASICHIFYSLSSLVGKFKEKKRTLVAFTTFSVFNIVMLISGLSVSIVTSSEMDSINKINVQESLKEALQETAVMDQWIRLQREFSCCGGRGSSGYEDWTVLMSGSVPDSCCTVQFPGCGHSQNIRHGTSSELRALRVGLH